MTDESGYFWVIITDLGLPSFGRVCSGGFFLLPKMFVKLRVRCRPTVLSFSPLPLLIFAVPELGSAHHFYFCIQLERLLISSFLFPLSQDPVFSPRQLLTGNTSHIYSTLLDHGFVLPYLTTLRQCYIIHYYCYCYLDLLFWEMLHHDYSFPHNFSPYQPRVRLKTFRLKKKTHILHDQWSVWPYLKCCSLLKSLIIRFHYLSHVH